MKVALFGANCFTCQLPRIKDGFVKLGHTIDYSNPDIIYSNDPGGFKDAINLKNDVGGKLILNILDIPWFLPEVNKYIKEWTDLLQYADIVTTISHTIKKDLESLVTKNVEVIYNPVKDVFYDPNIKKQNLFLYVGRANDKNKRIGLVYNTLRRIENGLNLINICGSENPGFGQYLGVIPDDQLNILYNNSKYLFLPSQIEGIGLPMIEAMICGCIPITCNDNNTAKEFCPKEFLCEPNESSILEKIIEINNDYDKYHNLALEFGSIYSKDFNKIKIAKNIINLYNCNYDR